MTQDGRSDEENADDFIYVFIEIFSKNRAEKGRSNRISLNKLFIKNHQLPPYKFVYYFNEAREYIKKIDLKKDGGKEQDNSVM